MRPAIFIGSALLALFVTTLATASDRDVFEPKLRHRPVDGREQTAQLQPADIEPGSGSADQAESTAPNQSLRARLQARLELPSIRFQDDPANRLVSYALAQPNPELNRSSDQDEVIEKEAAQPIDSLLKRSSPEDVPKPINPMRRARPWRIDPIVTVGVDTSIPMDGPLPDSHADKALASDRWDCHCADCPRPWGQLCYCFCATGLCYKPLYFEEINLERHGFGCRYCLQPWASAAHFFGRVPLLPYMMAADCPWECNYTLGHYRPGSCNPWRPHCLPISARGGFAQAAVVTGMFFLIP